MTNDQKGAKPLRRERMFTRWQIVLIGMGASVVLFCMGYMIVNPCPVIVATNDQYIEALDTHYNLLDQVEGLPTSRMLCYLDAFLCPVYRDSRRSAFLFAVYNSDRHETYYVFAQGHAVDSYYIYIVRDGEVMPRAKFTGFYGS